MGLITFVLLVFASFVLSESLSAITTLPIVSTTLLPNPAIASSTVTSIITSTLAQYNTVTYGHGAQTKTFEQDQIVYETFTSVALSQATGFITSTATVGSTTVYETITHASATTEHPSLHASTKSTLTSVTTSATVATGGTATSSPQPASTRLSSASKAAFTISEIVVPVFLVGLAFWIALVWRRRKQTAAQRAQYGDEDYAAKEGAMLTAAVAGKQKEEPVTAGRNTYTPESQIRLWDEKDANSVISAFYPHPGVRPLETLGVTQFHGTHASVASVHEFNDSGTVRSNSQSTQATGGITALPRLPRVAATESPQRH